MAHEITITLSDDEYAAVADAAAASGESVEALLHEAVARRFAARALPIPPSKPMDGRELEEYLYRIGFTANLPTHEPDTPEEEAEEEELAQLLSKGKSLTEMIIEDRGPY
jgi:hypothetical protein